MKGLLRSFFQGLELTLCQRKLTGLGLRIMLWIFLFLLLRSPINLLELLGSLLMVNDYDQ